MWILGLKGLSTLIVAPLPDVLRICGIIKQSLAVSDFLLQILKKLTIRQPQLSSNRVFLLARGLRSLQGKVYV